ncbi:MAG: hypothetical protein AB1505_34830, partial [Candidatus Latescibacterota bacterium]
IVGRYDTWTLEDTLARPLSAAAEPRLVVRNTAGREELLTQVARAGAVKDRLLVKVGGKTGAFQVRATSGATRTGLPAASRPGFVFRVLVDPVSPPEVLPSRRRLVMEDGATVGPGGYMKFTSVVGASGEPVDPLPSLSNSPVNARYRALCREQRMDHTLVSGSGSGQFYLPEMRDDPAGREVTVVFDFRYCNNSKVKTLQWVVVDSTGASQF